MSNTIKQAAEAARSRSSEVMGGAKNVQSEGVAVANDFLHTPWVRAALPFVNGGISGMVATTVIQPVDMIKVRIQLAGEGISTGPKPTPLSVTREILASGKALDLYTGLSAGLLRQAVYTTARLGFFDTFMGNLTARAKAKGQQIGFAERAAAGLTAGGLAAMIGNPADLALIRMQSDGLKPVAERKNYKSVVDALARISKSEGIAALWSGATPTVVRAMALNFGQLAFFSEAKAQLKTNTEWTARTQTLTASAIAGFFASFFSLPFDFVKTRLQKQTRGPDGKLPYKSMVDCFAQVTKQEGVLRFYRGFGTYYVRIAPHAMVTLIVADYLGWITNARTLEYNLLALSTTSAVHDANWRSGVMDADWDELSRQLLPPPGGQSVPTVVTALAFDTTQELLWAGNGYGRVTSFYGNNLQKYTSFRAHSPSEGAVHQLLFNDKGVIALGSRGIHMAIRRGPPVWPHITDEEMRDLRCMSFTSKATSEILVAGLQNTMFVVDVNKGDIVKRIPTTDHYIKMKKSRYICAATSDGHVHLLDPVKFAVVHKWRAHSAFINDMDVQQDFIVTCGTSLKQPAASYMLDPFVMVFDLKNLSTMPPIPFPPLAAYVRMHPRMLTTGIVASQGGQMHVVDLLNPNTSNVRQANVVGSLLTGIEIAPSGEAIALADTECQMHLWGSPAKCHFVELAQPTEWPDEELPQPHIDWKETTPLNSIGVPYYRETLLSALPNMFISDVGAPPPKFSQNDLAQMTKAQFGFYGPSRRHTHRNQAEDTRSADKGSLAIRAPKFLSEKARDAAKSSLAEAVIEAQVDQAAHALGTTELESLKPDVPALYQNVEIQFSKYGVDDFDFEFYNKTRYAGLENHIANSYANSLLQVLHFTPLVRNLALQHAATDCLSEKCLLCEIGFLSDMLQKTEGSSCHASNLLKCLANHPPASRLGLLEEDSRQGSLNKMMQHLTRFLLQTMADDYRTKSSTPAAMEQVLATSALTTIKCLNCRNETSRSGSSYVTDLTSPFTKGRGHRTPMISFSQVLKASVEGETATRGWCIRCNRYQSLQTRKIIQGIPSVLTLNVPLAESRDAELEQRMLWATPGWLPDEIGVIVDNGSFFCYQGEDLKLHLQRGVHNIQVYSLIGLSVNIESGSPQKSHLAALSPVAVDSGSSHKPHLVAMVNVAHAEPEAREDSQWHLFNDFSVKPVSSAEALTFNTRWKMPSVLVYQLKSANNQIDTDWVKNIDTSVLHIDFKPNAKEHPYRVLDATAEQPGPHSTVALDTEFVLAKQSEVEMKSDGVREVIRPNFHALGRVSIVRGEGEDEGLAFIDDWIQVREPVIDYLHKHSGILPGDLDPRTSSHCLVSLKVAYKRLWVLLNLGCRFVGHGLRSDFRVINIQVPQAQIIDTIDLFYQKNYRRKLSLKFLAWYLLKEGIQVDTHDSIEDARIALKLYRKYLEFEDAGITKKMLNEIYRAGDSVGWKPPGSDPPQLGAAAGGTQRTGTPPLAQADGPSTPIRKGGSGVTGSLTPMGFTPGGGVSPLR